MGSFMNQKTSFLTHRPQHGMVSLLFLLLFLLSCPSIPRAAAQPPNPPGTDSQLQYANFNPSMAVIIVVLVAALFFMGFFSIYIRHCNQASSGGSVRQALSMRRRAAAARGLDASVIETFPTFSYAEVKDHHIAKGALECAVCLNEFEDDDTLRLIPKCDHVFHPECIDAWLESHVTCPVCRANLTPQPDDPPVTVPELSREDEQAVVTENQQQNDDVSIRISNEEDKRVPQEDEGSIRPVVKRNLSFNVPHRPPRHEESSSKPTVKRNSSLNLPNWPPRSFSMKKPRLFSKFRSHSTGHSLVIPGENLDRYTLRLPEQIRKDVMNRSLLNRTNSCAVTLNRSQTGVGEGSNRGGRSYRRMESIEPEAKSDRWVFTIAPPFFTRGSSMKSPKMDVNGNGGGGEVGSTSTSTSTSRGGGVRSTVKMPSFKCLEPKGDEACLVSHDSVRPPI